MTNKMLKSKNIILLLLIVFLTISLVLLSNWTNGIVIFDNLSKTINKQIVYQTITLLGTIIFLFLLRWAKRTEFQEFFRKGNISAMILPETLVGINPKPNRKLVSFRTKYCNNHFYCNNNCNLFSGC